MPEFLEDSWRDIDGETVAGSLAVRRSLHLHEVVDLEEALLASLGVFAGAYVAEKRKAG
jgi:hypothetical protein